MNATAKSGSIPEAQQLPHRPHALPLGPSRAGRIRTPDRPLPLGEEAALLGELLGGHLGLLIHELHHLAAERHPLLGVVADPQPDEEVRPTHHTESDAADPLRQRVDLGQRVLVCIDHIVEEVGAEVHHGPQALPVHVAVVHEQPQIHRPEIADVVRQERLLPARVGRLVTAEVWHRVEMVRPVDEVHTRLARLPGAVNDRAEHVARLELPDDRPGAGVDQLVARSLLHGAHEGVRHRH